MIANGIEQIAVMADDKDRCRIALKIIDQPERALEIEVIGRLVEKQKIGARKQKTAASATRIRQPPENSASGCCCAASSKPRPAKMRAARAGAACAEISTRRV